MCSRKPQKLTFPEEAKLRDLTDFLIKSPDLYVTDTSNAPKLLLLAFKSLFSQMTNPSVYFHSRTLYVPTVPSLEEATRENLSKSLKGILCSTTEGSNC